MNRLGDTKHEQVAWHSFSIPSAAGVPKQNCVTMVFTVLSPFQTSPTQQYCVTIVLHVPLQTSTTKRNCVTRAWQTSMTKQNCGTNLVADSILQVLFVSLWGLPFSLISTILGPEMSLRTPPGDGPGKESHFRCLRTATRESGRSFFFARRRAWRHLCCGV